MSPGIFVSNESTEYHANDNPNIKAYVRIQPTPEEVANKINGSQSYIPYNTTANFKYLKKNSKQKCKNTRVFYNKNPRKYHIFQPQSFIRQTRQRYIASISEK
jgi:hypothetical protein